jgi:hypothetical protein
MTMITTPFRFTATEARRWLAIALILPAIALAQAPAAPEAKSAPAAEAKDAPKEAPKDAAPAPAAGAPKAEADAKAEPDAPTGPLAPLAWLNGCWAGTVNKREFREYWHPLRGGMMVGVGHNALANKTVSYEHLRLETKPEGVFYYATPPGQREVPFKLTDTRKSGPDEIYTFTNGANPFPQIISYRRATGGWLYVEVGGKQDGKDHKVIYPFRRVDCEGGEFIRK